MTGEIDFLLVCTMLSCVGNEKIGGAFVKLGVRKGKRMSERLWEIVGDSARWSANPKSL